RSIQTSRFGSLLRAMRGAYAGYASRSLAGDADHTCAYLSSSVCGRRNTRVTVGSMMQDEATRVSARFCAPRRRWRFLALIALAGLLITACGAGEEGPVAQTGDTVSVHYTGTLDDGTQFDSSVGGEPLTFTVGSGQLIAGFDTAVVGMEVGETKRVRMEPGEAYGERMDDRVIQLPREEAPEGLQAGQQVMLGQTPAMIMEVTDETVTVDANHPLAGQVLTFDIELVSVQ
ncbi:MAG: peptidylprolyl isomerase, partial [Dehalococcoidia bacterium]